VERELGKSKKRDGGAGFVCLSTTRRGIFAGALIKEKKEGGLQFDVWVSGIFFSGA
jgi:hypothetical protein